jgi:simple sugar transport system permease protein
MLLIMMIAGAVGGALYALIAVWLRVRAGISEILTTLILNWVAIKWAEYIGRWAWTDASGGGLGANATPPIAYRLPVVTGDLHIGIFLAPIVVAILWVVLSNTVWGYQVASVGANPRAAEYGGIRVARQTILLVVLSGTIAGLAGVIDLTGVSHRFSAYLSPGYGFLGICVAILAGESVPALMLWGPFMALLQNGGIVLRTSGLTPAIVGAITGLILILASVGEVIANYRLVRIIPRGEMPTVVDALGGGEPPGLDGRDVRDGCGS